MLEVFPKASNAIIIIIYCFSYIAVKHKTQQLTYL